MILATARIKFVTYSLKTHVESIRFRKKYTFFYKTAILSRFHRLTSEGDTRIFLKRSLKIALQLLDTKLIYSSWITTAR